MYGRILVPLDRSVFAEHALPRALGVARATGASIHVALVHFMPAWEPTQEFAGALFEEADEQVRLDEASYLDGLAATMRKDTGLSVTTALLDGPIVPALRDFAEDNEIGLIVMSTHGYGGIKRAWLGSVTDSLLRGAPAPLLLVRPPVDGERGATTRPALEPVELTHVLLAVDGSALAETAARRAASLALATGARVTLLRIVRPPLHTTSSYMPHMIQLNREELERRETEATEYVGALAVRFRADGLKVNQRVVVDYHPADAILREANDLGADLIALGTHGRGGMRRMVLGSVADKVIRGAPLPVFVLAPDAARAEPAELEATEAALLV
jgi:nucleotide-binding universal stress UspA family protein